MPKGVYLGKDVNSDLDIHLPLTSLKKHVVAFGNSGSGKTVLCKSILEEAALNGVPSIAVDPQGDIASLGIPAELWYDRELEKTNLFSKAAPGGLEVQRFPRCAFTCTSHHFLRNSQYHRYFP